MAFGSNTDPKQDRPKMTKSERHLFSVSTRLKLRDDPKLLPEKYNNCFPKFKGNATISARDFVEELYWNMSPRMIFDEGRLMMLFALSLEGQAREWYLSLPPACIEDSDQFEDMFMRRWSCNAQGTFNIQKFYQITRGREDIREFIQKFDRVVRDIPDHLKPPNANILDKFIKVVGGHLTYALRDKKPSTMVETKEIAMEVEESLQITKMDVSDHPKVKVEVKKEKSKDQHEETLLVLLKKIENLNEEINSRDRLYMNKLVALERAQKSSYNPKRKALCQKAKWRKDKPSSSQVPNNLAPTNAVEQDSSSKDEQSDEDENNDGEVDEQTNLVEPDVFNILLGGSYTHPPISEVTFKEEKEEPILNADNSGRFKGVQYSQKDNNKDSTTSKEADKDDSIPKQVPPKESLPKDPPKKDPPKKANPKKGP